MMIWLHGMSVWLMSYEWYEWCEWCDDKMIGYECMINVTELYNYDNDITWYDIIWYDMRYNVFFFHLINDRMI